MAQHRQTESAKQPDHYPAAIKVAGAEPGRECLAVSTIKPSLKPRLQGLHNHP